MNADRRIGFIGAGNMATALIRGLLSSSAIPSDIGVSDPDQEKLAQLSAETGVSTYTSNDDLVAASDIVVLAVKPQVMESVVFTLAPALSKRSTLLLSVAAGLPLDKFCEWSRDSQAVVRCMPNTPALVGVGASALIANDNCTDEQKAAAEAILQSVGEAVWLENEQQMDVVTALSGSGPAYFFLLIEAMQQAAEKLGLPADLVSKLSLQTALGAATLAKNSEVNAGELRHRVTSPGGTTEAALSQFSAEDFSGMVERALTRAAERSRELAK